MAENIIYEQPLSEHLRICLRLEQLFRDAQHGIKQESEVDARMALIAILEIVNIMERPDLKTKLVKALGQEASRLSVLEQSPDIDSKKLKELLNDLDKLSDYLHSSPGKLVQTLRENEFLNNIRLQLSKPGGPNSFSAPAFHFWLLQSPEQRNRDLLKWFTNLEKVQNVVNVLLQLARETGKFQLKFATQGFYQETLDLSLPYQLIRVSLPVERKVFPEISVGRHHLAIHFFSPNFEGRALRASHDLQFKLACCVG